MSFGIGERLLPVVRSVKIFLMCIYIYICIYIYTFYVDESIIGGNCFPDCCYCCRKRMKQENCNMQLKRVYLLESTTFRPFRIDTLALNNK
jgi:hypothetical protein